MTVPPLFVSCQHSELPKGIVGLGSRSDCVTLQARVTATPCHLRVAGGSFLWNHREVLFTRLLVPVDFAEPSVEALKLAVSIAMRVGARLSLLYVDADTLPGDGSDAMGALHRLAAREVPSSVHVDMLTDSGSPAERINHHAQDGEHDLVVMGTHGKTGLERVMLGSVAETVVRTCPVPVLVTHDRSGEDAP